MGRQVMILKNLIQPYSLHVVHVKYMEYIPHH